MEYTVTWFIENYSYCRHKNEEPLISPEFSANGLENTVWSLSVYPRGSTDQCKGFVSVALGRSKDDKGPKSTSVKCEVSFLAANGSTLVAKRIENTYETDNVMGILRFMSIKELLMMKAEYLPQDTLCVRFKILKNDEDISYVEQCTLRTRIGIEHISFIHVEESFSTLEPNKKKTFKIRTFNKKGSVASSVYLTDSSCWDGRIMLEITPSNSKLILSKYYLFLLNTSGNIVKCGEKDNRFDDSMKELEKLPLSITINDIMNSKDEYLPEDKLRLLCICTFSTGKKYEETEKILHQIPSVILNQMDNYDLITGKYTMVKKLSKCPGLGDDLIELYTTDLLCDVALRTKSKSFPAHKNLLCARSSAFKAMLTNEFRQKDIDYIQVYDLENKTVQKLLHFLYSDTLGKIEWELAMDLYYAAEKYTVPKLKLMCTSILLDNLSISNAVEILILADAFYDFDFQRAVGDFILKHEEHVFRSAKWKKLLRTNPALVGKTMLMKYMTSDDMIF